jgi:ComF family protein
MMQALRRIKRIIALRERRCMVCGDCFRPQQTAVLLCNSCRRQLVQRTGGFCPRCGLPHALDSMPLTLCSSCISTPPPWLSLRFYGLYDGLLRRIIIRYKHTPDLTLHPLMGHMLCQALRLRPFSPQEKPDVIVPVPLHPARLHMRGFNQSYLPARPAAVMLTVPLQKNILRRTRYTSAQTGLPKEERRRNLRDAFEADSCVRGRNVLLVDDVMTTGATLEHCAQALYHAGAQQVHAVVAARTPPHAHRQTA